MTMSKDDLTVVTNNKQINQEEALNSLTEFYEDNEHLVEMLGGLDIFNTLFEMNDEDFEQVAPSIYQIFNETLNEQRTRSEFSTLIASGQWQIDEVINEINVVYMTIDTIEELSPIKKNFLKQIVACLGNAIKQVYNLHAIDIPCEIDDEKNLPTYARQGDAGMDIISPEEYTIDPGETVIIPTGIKVAIPEGYAILIQPRSGMSVKTKLRIANTPGLIDSGYRDEIGVIVENIEPPLKDIEYEFVYDDYNNEQIKIKSILHGESYTIGKGQKFAQMRLVKVPTMNFVKVDSVKEIGENRGGGFGHTDLSE